MTNRNVQHHDLDQALNTLSEFVDTWSPYLHSLEHLDEWRSWKGHKIFIDDIHEVVDTALWCMSDGQWSLAAELLGIVASCEIVTGHDGQTKVERFCWGQS